MTTTRTPIRSIIATTLFALAPLIAQAASPLELFGVSLHNAHRDTLRVAAKKAGLLAERVDNNYFCDKYAVNGHLKGAKTLYLCYTGNTNLFANAEYVFETFMDTGLVSRVIDMVGEKYGTPDSQDGTADIGPVAAIWQEANDMRVKVWRGWPDTTTYLDLTDIPNKNHMDDQIQSQKAQQQKQQAKQQSNAF